MDECNDILRVGSEQQQIIQLYKAVKALSKMGVYTIMSGVWNAETNYNKKQMLVSYNNASYIKRIDGDCVNESPTLNPDKWQLISAGTPGATGPQGEPGPGIDTLSNVNLTLRDITVQYDTTDGMQIAATGRFTYENEQKDVPVNFNIPIKAGNNIVIDKAETNEFIEIKTTPDPAFDEIMTQNGINTKNTDMFFTFRDTNGRVNLSQPADDTFPSILTNHNVKSFFGNQSIYSKDGTGNIDLYNHHIKVTGQDGDSVLYLDFISSSNLKVNSLTDLFTLLNNREHTTTGYIYHMGVVILAEYKASGNISVVNGAAEVEVASWTDFAATTIDDTVTTV